jgi:MFS family permease
MASKEPAGPPTVRGFLIAAASAAILVPLLFFIRFGEIGGFAWGFTIFLVVFCLLVALGLYILPRTHSQTQVRLQNNWTDRLGAFWLVSCAFGPFLGWVITSVFPITSDSWQGLYTLRVILAAGLPVITALPQIRYLRVKTISVALPLIIIVTFLPFLSIINISRDLWEGPQVSQVQSTNQSEMLLRHTQKSLGPAR